MTTIAAKVKGEKVHISWDSQTTTAMGASNKSNKVRLINDQFAVGFTGHVRYANILEFSPVERIHKTEFETRSFDPYRWLVTTLVPVWRKSLKDAYDGTAGDKPDVPGGMAIVALSGNIYTLWSDFSVVAEDRFAAVGSGSMFANAAMHLGKTSKQAVEVASELDLYTGGEVKEMTL